MSNPVPPSLFQATVPISGGSVCDKFSKLFVTFPTIFYEWYAYMFAEDGSIATGFATDICAINCATLPVTPGPGPAGGPLGSTTLIQIPTNETVKLSWSAVPGATDYELARNTTPDLASATFIVSTVNTTYEDTTVTADTYYYFWVQARTTTSSGAFSPMYVAWSSTGGTLALPATTPSATTASAPSVTVTWTPVQGAASYDVLRHGTNVNLGATPLGNSTTNYFNDYSVAPGVSNYYFVTAKNNSVSTVTPDGNGALGNR